MKSTKSYKSYERFKKFLFFSSVLILLIILVFFVLKRLTVRHITVIGNKYLSLKDIKAIMRIDEGLSILCPSSAVFYERLKKTPWIKEAVIRKDLSGTITVFIKESYPVALCFFSSRTYLIDYEGLVLEDITEKIKGKEIFLPVIEDIDPFTQRDLVVEALKIINFVKENNLITKNDTVSIKGNNADMLTLQINDLSVIVGKGDLEKKFAMFKVVSSEIQKRNLTVQYYDLRFPDKVIVKPVQGDSETFR